MRGPTRAYAEKRSYIEWARLSRISSDADAVRCARPEADPQCADPSRQRMIERVSSRPYDQPPGGAVASVSRLPFPLSATLVTAEAPGPSAGSRRLASAAAAAQQAGERP